MIIKTNKGYYKVIKETDNQVYRLTLNKNQPIIKFIPIKPKL